MHYRKTDTLMIISYLNQSGNFFSSEKLYFIFFFFFEGGGVKNEMRSASDGFGLAKYHYIHVPIKYSL